MPSEARSRTLNGIDATLGIHCGFSQATIQTATHVEPGQDEARNERRRIKLDQRLLGDDGVDRDQHRGRDQHVERAGRGHRAGRERRVVAVAPHLRDRHPRERRGGRDRRAADRAEQRAGADGGIGERAAHAGEHRVAGLEQLGRHVAARGDRAHQDEQRNDRERIGAGELIGHEAEHLQRRRPAVDRGIAEQARDAASATAIGTRTKISTSSSATPSMPIAATLMAGPST